MRLLYLSADPGVPIFGRKGASVHVRAMAAAFDALGHELILASPALDPGEHRLPDGVRVAEIPAVRPRECATAAGVLAQAERQARAVTELALDERAEAIYERYSLSSFAGARTAAQLRIPLMLEVNAPLRAEERRFRELAHERVALRAERETFAAAGRIFAVSASLAAWLSSTGVQASRVEVMGNAGPSHTFAPKPAIAPDAELTAGFAGGLRPWHGIQTLLEGFELALEAGARMRLEVLGSGPADKLIERAALPEDRLTRLGHRPHDEALEIIARWDIGLAPFAAVDGFYFSPLKLFEYMAAGLCPVVTDVGELAEIVEHGRGGVVIPPGDAPALAGALVALDRDRVRLRTLAARAREAAGRRPSWRDNARRVVAAIENHGVPTTAGGRR